MRTKKEITAEIKKVQTAKRNAERKRVRCIERLKELKEEMRTLETDGDTEKGE